MKKTVFVSWILGFFLCMAAVSAIGGITVQAGTVELTMTEGETKYLFPSQDDRDYKKRAIQNGGWVSHGFEYVEVISDTSDPVYCEIRAKKETFSPVILRLDYYYWLDAGSVRYLARGYVDYKITVVGGSTSPDPWPSVTPGTSTQISLRDITLSKSEITLEEGTSYQLSIYKVPSNAAIQTQWFDNTAPEVANVDDNGRIYALREGETVITVWAWSGKYISKKCKVTVKAKAGSGKRLLATPALEESLYVGQSLYLRPDDGGQAKWASSAPWIASVGTNGKVKARKAGTALITALTPNGRRMSCRLTVKSGFSVSREKVVLKKKGKKTITVTRSLKAGGIRIRPADSKCITCRMGKFKSGKAKLTITAKKKGKTSVTLTNTYSGEKKKIAVMVR